MRADGIKIIPVTYGSSVMSEQLIFENGDKDAYRPIVFMIYLIQQTGRRILVDAGCDTMPGWDMKHFIGPVAALAGIGITPADITDVIITHAHHDHIEGVRHFTNADIYIQKDEYEAGKQYFTNAHKVYTFDDTLALTDRVSAVRIGGHSVGSCVVEIDGGDSITVIAGDECYAYACLDRQIPTGVSCNRTRSRAFIEKYSSDIYSVLLCHDIRR